ncbi:MAG: hypothetical protein JWM11_351 [Planctomycetaceae bacterium]|nr:hypothetical protein [Planctomycetaceae bacterium]
MTIRRLSELQISRQSGLSLNTHFRILAFVLGFVLTCLQTPATCSGYFDSKITEQERSETFAWLSSLGYPDVKDAQFIRVTLGNGAWQDDEPPGDTYGRGFLLSQAGETFTVLLLDLTTRTFTKSRPGAKERERVGFEEQSLSEFAAFHLQAIRAAFDPKAENSQRASEDPLSERATVFVLAWACARKGQGKLAVELYDQSTKMDNWRDTESFVTLRPALAKDIAHAEMWRGMLQFRDTAVPRESLLPVFENIVKNFRESEHRARARIIAMHLKKMVQEDRKHVEQRKTGKPIEELPQPEQIAELIFQLRNQSGFQEWRYESCDIFSTNDRNQDSPAHRLVEKGYDAIPQLIEALDDARLTRFVGCFDGSCCPHTVLSVSDCAEQIISRIAGFPFYEAKSPFDRMYEVGEAPSVKQKVADWHAKVRLQGEQRLLLEEIEAGQERAGYLAQRLVEKYPEVALPALIAGARQAKKPWVRAELVRRADQLKGDGPLVFLLEELKSGPTRLSRLEAAKAVHRRGRPEGVAAMIVEWNQDREKPNVAVNERGFDLARFLVACGKVEAIEALAQNLKDRPIAIKLAIVSAFGTSRNFFRSLTASNDGPQAIQLLAGKDHQDLRLAVVKLLLAALDDLDHWNETKANGDGTRVLNPRVCDVAGQVLNDLDPTHYPFVIASTAEDFDRARHKLKNVIRQDLGLPAIPAP